MRYQSRIDFTRSDALRKLIGSVLAVSALVVIAAAPAAAVDLCIIDPAVNVDGTTIQVGLYTHDPSLLDAGAIPARTPIVVTLLGPRDGHISTDVAAWRGSRPNTIVSALNALPGGATGDKETVEIDAFVPSQAPRADYYIQVTLPDGSVKTASAPANGLARLKVEVPVQR
jgi:hypothetical protein